MIRKMLKEEWRMHSNIYKGGSFKYFPLLVFALTLTFTYLTVNYSTVEHVFLERFVQVLFGFIGFAVGSIGFSSKSAMKNVLGPVNMLVYSSRTLPISRKKLLVTFAIKDIIYYLVILVLPVSLALVIVLGAQVMPGLIIGFLLFLAAMTASIILTRLSIKAKLLPRINYSSNLLQPVAAKSLLDLLRSSGGLLKILFSFAVLTGFYWFVVLYFPFAQSFLNNPLVSFSVITGLLTLTVYNWLNRFDSFEDYNYLPFDKEDILEAKKQAFLTIALPLTTVSVLISYYFYPSEIMVGVISAVATTTYTLAIATKITGLKPNENLFDTSKFLKFLLANSLLTVPLLILSLFYETQKTLFIALLLLTMVCSLILLKKREKQFD